MLPYLSSERSFKIFTITLVFLSSFSMAFSQGNRSWKNKISLQDWATLSGLSQQFLPQGCQDILSGLPEEPFSSYLASLFDDNRLQVSKVSKKYPAR